MGEPTTSPKIHSRAPKTNLSIKIAAAHIAKGMMRPMETMKGRAGTLRAFGSRVNRLPRSLRRRDPNFGTSSVTCRPLEHATPCGHEAMLPQWPEERKRLGRAVTQVS